MSREIPPISQFAAADVDRLLLGVVHDLRAPLRQSLLHAQMLERSLAGTVDAGREAQLLSILNGNRLANHFLSRLGEYCHAGAGLSDAPDVAVDVLLQNAIRTVGNDSDVEMIVADIADFSLPAPAQKVFVEFLDNARKFRRGPVTIRINSIIAGPDCIFEIHDNGIGFDATYGETIWEPLQRLHGIGEYPGFGFGLAISRRIVSRLNGKAWANSVPGEGSSFFFSIPSI